MRVLTELRSAFEAEGFAAPAIVLGDQRDLDLMLRKIESHLAPRFDRRLDGSRSLCGVTIYEPSDIRPRQTTTLSRSRLLD